MAVITPLSTLEDEERAARNRLTVCRARLYRAGAPSAPGAERRLHELERRWISAAGRLRRARAGH